jgi:RimJ/RimL family protein N-acetyltransferase
MSPLGPTLETPRLTLRPLAPEDFDAWAEMMADESTRFIGGPQQRSGAWRGFVSVAGAWAMQGYSMFSVIEKASGRWIGRVGPWVPEGWPGTEVGWGLTKAAFGKGYATEAAAASIDWAFDALGWTDVIHIIDPENVPSQAVARRLGSTNRGPGQMPEPFHTYRVDIWGQTRDEWRARRA